MYIFRVSINPTDLTLFVVLQSIRTTPSAEVFLYFVFFFASWFFCMYVLHTSYKWLFVRGKQPQNTNYQALSLWRVDQEDLNSRFFI